jgi:four helix bundle protein
MSEKSQQLKTRTEAFAVAAVKCCDSLPNTMAGRRVSQQLIDASTFVAANYRAACRAYTDRLFVSKLAIVDEEADESELWFRVIRKTGLRTGAAIDSLEHETHELACIFAASVRTARAHLRKRKLIKSKGARHSASP